MLRSRNAGELIVSAAAGLEFADLAGRHHSGGGSHGSLLNPGDSRRCRCSRSASKTLPGSIVEVMPAVLEHFGVAFPPPYARVPARGMKTGAELAAFLRRRGIGDGRVLAAIAAVPRELFVPAGAAVSRLRRPGRSPIGSRPDDLAAVHGRDDLRRARAPTPMRASWTWAPARAIRPPCWRSIAARGRDDRARARARRSCARDACRGRVTTASRSGVGDGTLGVPERPRRSTGSRLRRLRPLSLNTLYGPTRRWRPHRRPRSAASAISGWRSSRAGRTVPRSSGRFRAGSSRSSGRQGSTSRKPGRRATIVQGSEGIDRSCTRRSSSAAFAWVGSRACCSTRALCASSVSTCSAATARTASCLSRPHG